MFYLTKHSTHFFYGYMASAASKKSEIIKIIIILFTDEINSTLTMHKTGALL